MQHLRHKVYSITKQEAEQKLHVGSLSIKKVTYRKSIPGEQSPERATQIEGMLQKELIHFSKDECKFLWQPQIQGLTGPGSSSVGKAAKTANSILGCINSSTASKIKGSTLLSTHWTACRK